jgi:hypothetical protein
MGKIDYLEKCEAEVNRRPIGTHEADKGDKFEELYESNIEQIKKCYAPTFSYAFYRFNCPNTRIYTACTNREKYDVQMLQRNDKSPDLFR